MAGTGPETSAMGTSGTVARTLAVLTVMAELGECPPDLAAEDWVNLVDRHDPASLARDIAIARDRDYHLARLEAVDAFPHTAHVETFALLEPK